MTISTVCVYCGASDKIAKKYKTTAKKVGAGLAKRNLGVVYGGSSVGLMGIVADAALEENGHVIGIIPSHILSTEVRHNGLSELHIVQSMHERKKMMETLSDVFVILPGGLGTLDEAFEILTWKKLKLHDKTIIFFNQDDYWTPLLKLIDKTVSEGFASADDKNMFNVVTDTKSLFKLFDSL